MLGILQTGTSFPRPSAQELLFGDLERGRPFRSLRGEATERDCVTVPCQDYCRLEQDVVSN